jgi:hypothetical protein
MDGSLVVSVRDEVFFDIDALPPSFVAMTALNRDFCQAQFPVLQNLCKRSPLRQSVWVDTMAAQVSNSSANIECGEQMTEKKMGPNTSSKRGVILVLIVVMIAIGGLFLGRHLLTTQIQESEPETSSHDKTSRKNEENLSTDKTSMNTSRMEQSGDIRGSSASKAESLGETSEAKTARETMLAEMDHALTPSSEAEALELRALNEAGNIEGRLKAVSELETSKPRGFVNAILAVSAADDPLVKRSAVDALGRSYFPQALQRLNVMIQDGVQHPTVREGVLSAITTLAKAASENALYPSADSDNAKIIAETRAVLLAQLRVAAKLRDGREIPTTIQVLEALSYLQCPEMVAIIQAKLRESYADFPERDALVVALGRSGFSEAQTVLEEYQTELEETLTKSSSTNPLILQTVRDSLALVKKTQQSLKTK